MTVRSPHHRHLHLHALEPHDPVHRAPSDGPLAQQLEPEVDEERGRGLEVVDDDPHVLHPLDRHASMLGNPGSSRHVGQLAVWVNSVAGVARATLVLGLLPLTRVALGVRILPLLSGRVLVPDAERIAPGTTT